MSDLSRDRLAECAGKSPFATKPQAIAVIKRRRHPGAFLAYKCRFCGSFHIGQVQR